MYNVSSSQPPQAPALDSTNRSCVSCGTSPSLSPILCAIHHTLNRKGLGAVLRGGSGEVEVCLPSRLKKRAKPELLLSPFHLLLVPRLRRGEETWGPRTPAGIGDGDSLHQPPGKEEGRECESASSSSPCLGLPRRH